MAHVSVLLKEVIALFDPKTNENFMDATIGEGGHAKAILEKTVPSGILLGIDRDESQLERAKRTLRKFKKRTILIKGSFGDILSIVKEENRNIVWSGVLFDLGWSQAQIEKSGRGFSFLKDEQLDMRYDANPSDNKQQTNYNKSLTAKEIVNRWGQEDIECILREYSQERFTRPIAKAIVKERKNKPIQTTLQLVDIIKKSTPAWYHHQKIHPATKTFQALRIAVNDEFSMLERGLNQAFKLISKNGKIVVISFHSGEDRIVKGIFKECQAQGMGEILTKKPITPSLYEIRENPHSRSAKLRGFLKTV